MNEIGASAQSLIKDLAEIEQDLNSRIAVADKMGNMVETVAFETKKRVLYEQSLRPVFADTDMQTACELTDMEMVCALDHETQDDEDPWLLMEKIRAAHRGKQRCQVSV
jgi:hypothetical protein